MKPLDSLREELQGILAGKEYQIYYRDNQNFLLNLLQRLKNWLSSILKSLFPHADIANTAIDWLSYGIAAIGILLLLLMLYLIASRFVRKGHINLKRLDLAKELTLTVQHHISQAHSLAGQGEYAFALRHLFLGFLLYLDKSRWIEAKAWKTNWEYCAELKNRAPQLADFFTSLAVKFEEAVYGGRPITEEEYWLYHNQASKWIQEGETV